MESIIQTPVSSATALRLAQAYMARQASVQKIEELFRWLRKHHGRNRQVRAAGSAMALTIVSDAKLVLDRARAEGAQDLGDVVYQLGHPLLFPTEFAGLKVLLIPRIIGALQELLLKAQRIHSR